MTGSLTATAVVARLRAAGCVFAEDEARLLRRAAADPAELAALVERRERGEPLEYLLGWVGFCGLRIAVEPGVFVPRQRTAYLARRAIASARRAPGRPVVVDLCCGSGAVAAAVAASVAGVELYAADIDPVAVRCARRNLPGARVLQGDLDAPLPARLRGRVDVLVANTPYVPSDEVALLPPEAREHEPRTALDGGPDGLRLARRLAAVAPGWLAPGGTVLVETGTEQAPVLARAMRDNGLRPRVHESVRWSATVVTGTRPARG